MILIKNPIVFTLTQSPISQRIIKELGFEEGKLLFHHFPDGESYIRIDSDVKDRDIILIESLDYPDNKIFSILLFFETAKDLAVKSIGFIAPYLAYLRQDTRFKFGEGVTSRYVAKMLSRNLDWLMTIMPHLHRYKELNEIYSIPSFSLQATENIANWIKIHLSNPFIIGPDAESKPWVENIAHKTKSPYIILKKIRHGDKEVEIKIPNIQNYKTLTPVLIDDIISTGRTMLAAIKLLVDLGFSPPVCIGVHAIFSDNSYEELSNIRGIRIITCNTINHITNEIDVADQFIENLRNSLWK